MATVESDRRCFPGKCRFFRETAEQTDLNTAVIICRKQFGIHGEEPPKLSGTCCIDSKEVGHRDHCHISDQKYNLMVDIKNILD